MGWHEETTSIYTSLMARIDPCGLGPRGPTFGTFGTFGKADLLHQPQPGGLVQVASLVEIELFHLRTRWNRCPTDPADPGDEVFPPRR